MDDHKYSSELQSTPNFGVEKYLNWAMLVLVVLAAAIAMSPSVADPDLWGHVQYGIDILETGEIPATTTYSYTANGFRWINHENLSEIVMASVVRYFGPQGLLIGKFVLSLIVIVAIVWFNLRQRVSLVATGMIALLVAWNLGYHWSFRPQLSSFIFFTLLVLLLQVSFSQWRDKWYLKWPAPKFFSRDETKSKLQHGWLQARLLWFAPVIFLFWANSHGGYVAGVCIFIAYTGCRAIEAFYVRRGDCWGLVARLGLVATAVVLATLVNPYSYRLPLWLLESLGKPRPEIADWSSDQLFSLIGLKFWALIFVAGFSLVSSRKSLDFTQLVVLGLTLWQAASHFRHVPFFAILCGFWLGPHLHSALERFQTNLSKSNKRGFLETRVGKISAAGVAVVVLALMSLQLGDRLTQLKVDKQDFPVDAFEFIAEQNLGGRMVVTYDWAQYAIAAFCVENRQSGPSRVAFDGRFRTCYPQNVVDMHFDFLYGHAEGVQRQRSPLSPPIDPARVLRTGQPDLVILRRNGELTERHMNEQSDNWILLYQDAISQVWGRRNKYGNPESPNYLEAQKRNISNCLPQGYANWPALPKTESWSAIDQGSKRG